ncbi:GTP-binding protein At3g49725, chloroplastic isoform X2 [Cryptomeria japonica]|uniref:GTP-binding protein At3g49725, chloroplastic isoform X2 n=1 Tax=Cryptomeria japonica TaxID=3369 RepID=UPI0027DAA67D|nr:GTP-binding protein At3g49725, chloroplastic isoform X2 [Cryptomeria japonica]
MFTAHLRKSFIRNLLKPTSNGFKIYTDTKLKSQMPTCPTLPKAPHKPHLDHSNHAGIINSPSKLSIPTTQFRNFSSERDNDESEYFYNRDTKEPPKLFVVQPRVRSECVLQAKLLEAINLADSLEEQREEGCGSKTYVRKKTPHLLVQNPGTRSTKSHAVMQDGLDAVFVNAMLTGIQQRNLERAWGKPVFDRMGLIIEIFNAHANTKEAKLQAELAALMYKKTRLVRVRGLDGRLTFGTSGEAEVVSGRGRTSGGRGFISGAGETELQLQRRRILERRNQLLSEIEEVRRTRALQRAARQRHRKGFGRVMPVVAVVGYTNAGKSSLVAALSQSDLYIDDKLFATLDPRVRSIFLPSGQKMLLSDTVGFISDLPVQLVEAFQATLEEVTEADLLVHVIDVSAPNAEEHRDSVLDVLQQIGVSSEKLENMIEVWNKVDLLGSDCENIMTVEHLDHEREACNDEIPLSSSAEDFLLHEENATKESTNGATISMEEVGDAETNNILSENINANLSPKGFSCVKASAITGIGLQELLHLLDEKLDEKLKPAANLEDKYFVKWRPSLPEAVTHNVE